MFYWEDNAILIPTVDAEELQAQPVIVMRFVLGGKAVQGYGFSQVFCFWSTFCAETGKSS